MLYSPHYLAKAVTLCACSIALSGCLVSEEPVLDAETGRAAPLSEGVYIVCPVEDENADGDDCDRVSISSGADGLYRFDNSTEDTAQMRFRRVGRRGYAAQSHESDTYLYYYGAGDSERFRLTMMLCADLPAKLRARLIKGGDLASDDDNFESCDVKTLKGLKKSAKAYHRGKAAGEEVIALEFRPVQIEE